MARRVGSASAAKVRSRRSELCITGTFYNSLVIYIAIAGTSRGKLGSPGLHGRLRYSQPMVSLSDLRRHAVERSLFEPTTLKRAIERLGFVQADPIRAPAR